MCTVTFDRFPRSTRSTWTPLTTLFSLSVFPLFFTSLEHSHFSFRLILLIAVVCDRLLTHHHPLLYHLIYVYCMYLSSFGVVFLSFSFCFLDIGTPCGPPASISHRRAPSQIKKRLAQATWSSHLFVVEDVKEPKDADQEIYKMEIKVPFGKLSCTIADTRFIRTYISV